MDGEFCYKRFFVNTAVKHGDESTIQNLVKSQGQEKEYKEILSQQSSMFQLLWGTEPR